MKKLALLFIMCAFALCAFSFNNLYAANEAFKNYVVKSDETLNQFAKQYLSDDDYIEEFLKFNLIKSYNLDFNKTKFKDLSLKDGDILLIPSLEILKLIKKAKTESEKTELIQKFKKFKYSDFYVKINDLKDKMKQGGEITERVDKISQDAQKK